MDLGTPDNFLALESPACDYNTARFAILPVPYDATASYASGTRDGARAIISASQQVELYDNHLKRESWEQGIATLSPLETDARGPEHMIERVYEASKQVVADGKFLFGLGGEHSISSGFIKATHEKYANLSVLQIDAHADLRDSYQGSPYSHASVMKRVYDMGIPFVGVGIRNYSSEEAEFIEANNIPQISARRCCEADDWNAEAISHLTENVYLTIDIDGFDPAYAPGTGTPEPGGLNWYQVADLLSAVSEKCNIVGADIVEVRPIPGNNVTEFLAAKLAYRIIGLASQP